LKAEQLTAGELLTQQNYIFAFVSYYSLLLLTCSPAQNTPKGNRTPVTGLRTRRPGPLDDGGKAKSKSKTQKSKKIAAVGIEPTTLGL
jgi:hypothetical protein